MFEDNLSKSPPYFFCETQNRKEHCTPAQLWSHKPHPQAVYVFMHHKHVHSVLALAVPRVSPAHPPHSILWDESFSESPAVCPGPKLLPSVQCRSSEGDLGG